MIYVLDKDLIAQSILSNAGPEMCPYFDDYLRETIAGGSVLYEFECPANHEAASHLSSDGYLIRPDLNGELILLKIRTVEERKTSDGALLKVVFAESAALELIHDILRPVALSAVTAAQAVGEVLEGTNWQVGTIEWLGVENFEFDNYPTVLEALHEINERYGGDIVFRPEFINGQVTGRYVDLLQHRGSSGVFRFDNTTDIQEVERVEDSSLLVTALIGVGKSNDAGVPLTFADLSDTLYLKDGTAVDKPLGLDWVGNPQALQTFSSNGKHKYGVFKTEEVDSQALLKRTWAELLKYSEPQLSYAVRVALLARSLNAEYVHKTVTIGDSGDVIDHEFEPPLMVAARVIERVTSFSDPEKDSVVLGNFIRYEKDPIQIMEDLQDVIRTESGKWEQGGGGEMIFKSPIPPENPLADALWLDTSTSPEVLKRWDGSVWQKASPTAAADIGAETPQGAQDKADAAEGAAIDTAAGDATEKAGAAEENAKDYADAQDIIIADNMADFVAETYEKKIIQSNTEPVGPVAGDLWIDTSVTPYVWKRYTGTAWVAASATSLAELDGQLQTAQIALGAITSVLIQDDAIVAAKIATGAVTADAIAANSISSNMIVTAGLDAGVIKFGTMSGDRILANTIDANRLKAGTVIADDITFTGTLSGVDGTFTGTLDGADGTFSGSLEVGDRAIHPGVVKIGFLNGFENIFTTYDTGSEYIRQEQAVRINAGGLVFNYINNDTAETSESVLTQESYGMTVQGNFDVLGEFRIHQNSFGGDHARLAPGGPIIIATDGMTELGNYVQWERDLDFFGSRADFNSADVIFDGLGTFNGNVNFGNVVNFNWLTYFNNSAFFEGMTYFNDNSTFSSPATFSNTANFNWTTNFNYTTNFASGRSVSLDGTNYVNGTTYFYSGTIRNYGSEFMTNQSETGFCGVGGMTASYASSTSPTAGVGVNFRMKKTYTPSSISLAGTSSNLINSGHVLAIDISQDGFWLYVLSGQASVNNFRYWRGRYTA